MARSSEGGDPAGEEGRDDEVDPEDEGTELAATGVSIVSAKALERVSGQVLLLMLWLLMRVEKLARGRAAGEGGMVDTTQSRKHQEY